MPRSFLVLQGTASLFFYQLARALQDKGFAVHRVNFCGGDLLYGGTGAVLNYSGEVGNLPQWYDDVVRREGITDVVMFGDCRDIHREMLAVSAEHDLRVHVFEEGYVRPHWITLESHGVNGRSLLPRDPAWYLQQRSVTPPAEQWQATGYNLYERAFHDIAYRFANAMCWPRFPKYRSHRPKNGFLEYSGLAVRMLLQRKHRREAERVTRELLDGVRPYYLFPLQLNSDAQIVVHSSFDGIRAAISHVLESFARYAPRDALLVIKNHPLDTGLIEYRNFSLKIARAAGMEDRIRFIDAGHLPTLLERARGVVVINSTVGLSALHHKRPLVALGSAIYNLSGLTWQGDLDDFWLGGMPPDMDLYHAFLDYVMHHTQINGDFYTRSGIAMAIAGAVARLERADD
ncbi:MULTISPECIES: capsule biosynthesis protein [Burkholderia]|uniref:Capsular biosynthesis protein n=2 Tax=Burkholderia cepacia complex TaxID=87882 RepID=A0A8A8D3V9_9BURK|nr:MULTISPECIES: capsular biosynthesis protein [Burkholderia]MBN3741367.1 capsular biosynthesis protein [Burkholderia sp. Tr-20355]MCA8421794.1 capsular biosynthesis protein [Burkholderia seminalis]QTO19384.1 capsular biosynthesis protein [Burkholderia seminalis]RQS83566.1 capsular biosynthesis protein [Burkholderia seminalis]RQS99780.1 capsular biosynthesis protein [Burkholderia seminalis]